MKVVLSVVLSTLSALAPLAVVAESPEAGSAADAPAPIMAVWVEKTVEFTYVGFTSYYSCDGLRDKASRILAEIGARPGFKVTASSCAHTNGPDRMPRLRIVAALPRAATPELLADLAKDASRSELAAKAGGKVMPTAEATAEFPARTRRVDFRDSRTGVVQVGDCELVEQMRDNVFVPLGATIVMNDMSCVPHEVHVGSIELSLDVLEPVPQR